MARLAAHREYQRRLGLWTGVKWSIANAADRRGLIREGAWFHPRTLAHPVYVRMGNSSDIDVFKQIFLAAELDFWDEVKMDAAPELILDLGANVGYASAVFLSRFPHAFVLAVEPDPRNAHFCRRNLAPYGDRAKVVEGAIWHSCSQLVLSRGTFGDGREHATEVRQARPGEVPDVTAWDIPALLAMCPHPKIDILKIDIEGSEQSLFSQRTEDWLPLVRNLCIEIHGAACARTVEAAMEPYTCRRSRSGEYTLYLDIGRR